MLCVLRVWGGHLAGASRLKPFCALVALVREVKGPLSMHQEAGLDSGGQHGQEMAEEAATCTSRVGTEGHPGVEGAHALNILTLVSGTVLVSCC